MRLYNNIQTAAKEIAPIFEEMNWHWLSDRPPNEKEIYMKFISLRDCLGLDLMSVSSGRLQVTRIIGDGRVVYSLAPEYWKEYSDYINSKI